MNSSQIWQLLAQSLQLIGIIVGAGLIFEKMLRSGPMKWLRKALDTPDIKAVRNITNLVKQLPPVSPPLQVLPSDINDYYEKSTSLSFYFLPLCIITLAIFIALGIWVLLIYLIRNGQHNSLWNIVWFWLGFLVVQYLFSSPFQIKLRMKIEPKLKLTIKTFILQFARNWVVYPLILIKIELLLLWMVLLLMPAWLWKAFIRVDVSKLDLKASDVRQDYYLKYAVVALIISTVIQIILIF